MQGSLPNLMRYVEVLQEHAPTLADEFAIATAKYAPVGHSETAGRLRDSLIGEVDGDGTALCILVTSDVPEAVYVIEGTDPHPIDPRHPKEALFWPEAAHPYAHVNHPGTAPNDFGKNAEEDIIGIFEEESQIIADEAFGG